MPDEQMPMEPHGPKPRAVLTIVWNADGSMGASWPNDEMVARFMMDKGCEIIRGEFAKRNAPMIQSPGVNGLRGVAGALAPPAPRRPIG